MKYLVLFLLLSTGASAQQNLTIQVNEGTELMSVIQFLGGQLPTQPSPYKEDVKRYFVGHRNDPAVLMVFNFKFQVYYDLVECGLAFDNFPDIRAHHIPDSSFWVKYIGRDTLDRYLRLCMQFYKDTHFHDFFVAHKPMYDQWGQGLRDSIAEPLRIFDSLINTRHDHHWLVCPDPMNGWGAHTIVAKRVNPAYQQYFIYQVGYQGDTDEKGRMVFGADIYDWAWHEGTHAFTDSILEQYKTAIDSLAYLMPASPALGQQNVDTWQHYFNELLPRAVSAALHRQFRGDASYRKVIRNETRNGFIHVTAVSDAIYDNFIHTRRVTTFEALLPYIFAALRSYKLADSNIK